MSNVVWMHTCINVLLSKRSMLSQLSLNKQALKLPYPWLNISIVYAFFTFDPVTSVQKSSSPSAEWTGTASILIPQLYKKEKKKSFRMGVFWLSHNNGPNLCLFHRCKSKEPASWQLSCCEKKNFAYIQICTCKGLTAKGWERLDCLNGFNATIKRRLTGPGQGNPECPAHDWAGRQEIKVLGGWGKELSFLSVNTRMGNTGRMSTGEESQVWSSTQAITLNLFCLFLSFFLLHLALHTNLYSSYSSFQYVS